MLKAKSKKGIIVAAIVVVLIVGAATLIYINTFTYKVNRILRHIDQYTAVYTEYKDDLIAVMDSLDLKNESYKVYKYYLEKSTSEQGKQPHIPFDEVEALSEQDIEVLRAVLDQYSIFITFSPNRIHIEYPILIKPYTPEPHILYSPQGTPGLLHRKGTVVDLGDGWYFVVDAGMMFL